MIDILPYVGDGRGTAFSGSYRLDGPVTSSVGGPSTTRPPTPRRSPTTRPTPRTARRAAPPATPWGGAPRTPPTPPRCASSPAPSRRGRADARRPGRDRRHGRWRRPREPRAGPCGEHAPRHAHVGVDLDRELLLGVAEEVRAGRGRRVARRERPAGLPAVPRRRHGPLPDRRGEHGSGHPDERRGLRRPAAGARVVHDRFPRPGSDREPRVRDRAHRARRRLRRQHGVRGRGRAGGLGRRAHDQLRPGRVRRRRHADAHQEVVSATPVGDGRWEVVYEVVVSNTQTPSTTYS